MHPRAVQGTNLGSVFFNHTSYREMAAELETELLPHIVLVKSIDIFPGIQEFHHSFFVEVMRQRHLNEYSIVCFVLQVWLTLSSSSD